MRSVELYRLRIAVRDGGFGIVRLIEYYFCDESRERACSGSAGDFGAPNICIRKSENLQLLLKFAACHSVAQARLGAARFPRPEKNIRRTKQEYYYYIIDSSIMVAPCLNWMMMFQ